MVFCLFFFKQAECRAKCAVELLSVLISNQLNSSSQLWQSEAAELFQQFAPPFVPGTAATHFVQSTLLQVQSVDNNYSWLKVTMPFPHHVSMKITITLGQIRSSAINSPQVSLPQLFRAPGFFNKFRSFPPFVSNAIFQRSPALQSRAPKGKYTSLCREETEPA